MIDKEIEKIQEKTNKTKRMNEGNSRQEELESDEKKKTNKHKK